MIVTTCYFLKSIKSVFILVQCNTSLSENYRYVAHSYVTVGLVCVLGWIWEKNWFVCARWPSVPMKSVIEQGFSQEVTLDNKALKTFVKFQIWWKCSKFERRRIRIRTLSHPYTICISFASIPHWTLQNSLITLRNLTGCKTLVTMHKNHNYTCHRKS